MGSALEQTLQLYVVHLWPLQLQNRYMAADATASFTDKYIYKYQQNISSSSTK